MISRWGHGHSIAGGFVVAMLLDKHLLYVFALGLLIGGLLIYSSRTLRALGRAGASRAAELHHVTVERIRWQAAEHRAKAEERIRRADEQKAAEKRAYIQGALDAER